LSVLNRDLQSNSDTCLHVQFSGNECLKSRATVHGQLTIIVNMTAVCIVDGWGGDNDNRQVVIHIVYSKLQFLQKFL
jgi:hypothetical protein